MTTERAMMNARQEPQMVTRGGSRPASAEQRLKEPGIQLPAPPEPFGDVPSARIHVLEGRHFALDTAADEIAALVRGFVASSRLRP